MLWEEWITIKVFSARSLIIVTWYHTITWIYYCNLCNNNNLHRNLALFIKILDLGKYFDASFFLFFQSVVTASFSFSSLNLLSLCIMYKISYKILKKLKALTYKTQTKWFVGYLEKCISILSKYIYILV